MLDEFPSKELRNIVDQGKKEIKEGIVIAFCKFEEKVGVAVGITSKLIDKYDAVTFVKEAAEILSYLKKAEEDDKQKVEEDERLKKGYEFSKDSKHTAVLIVPTEINIEKTKVAISNFNKQYFKFDELDTKAVLLNKENQMVSIKSFDDEIKAMKYYKTFTENKSYLVDINKDGLVFFVLSYENYPIFYLKKDTKEYLDFFGKNYQ